MGLQSARTILHSQKGLPARQLTTIENELEIPVNVLGLCLSHGAGRLWRVRIGGYYYILISRDGSIFVYRADVRSKRPALFFISSVSTTTTISTVATCYATILALPAITTCKRKRKRAIISDGKLMINCVGQTRPSPFLLLAMDLLPEFEPSQVESGLEESTSEERQGKFLLYWLTTTSTSTTTSFTSTYTVGSVFCTPAGATTCPGLG